MIITISGTAGSGKSTAAKMLAAKLGLKHYSVGDLMRQMAKEQGITVLELNKRAEKDKAIDKELDRRQIAMGKTEDNFVIDGRLTAHFIPHATLKVFLDAKQNVRAQRILKDRRALEDNTTLLETMKNMAAREASEKKRYRKYYGVDYTDTKGYDCVIDTTFQKPEEVVAIIKIALKKKL